MKKIVIAGSASLQEKVAFWKSHWEQKDFSVINYPCAIKKEDFIHEYPNVYKKFFEDILKTNVFFVMNENKNDIDGYIGAETFAEICFAVAQNQINDKKIEIILLQMPATNVQSYDEINLWIKLGWICIYDEKM